jgi:uncharacterized protein (TIGR00369 family)
MAEGTQPSIDDRLAGAKERWDNRPLHKFFDIRIDELAEGYASFVMPLNEHNRGGVHGAAHGGVLAFLADVAALAAISTLIRPDERPSGTAELNISYLSPGTGNVTAQARVLRKGRTLAVADVDMKDESGKLLTKSRVSYAIHPPEMEVPEDRRR